MSRKRRIWFPGAMYHITARGNRRSSLFECDEDYLSYLQYLSGTRERYPFKLHGYCLMTNHLHLQLETEEIHIKEIMKEMHGRYAMWFNHKYRLTGHLFQGRYGAEVIDTDEYLLAVSRYIHLNPLEAYMVKHPADYRWSSYPVYLGGVNHVNVITSKVLSYFSPSDRVAGYKAFVEGTERQYIKETDARYKYVV